MWHFHSVLRLARKSPASLSTRGGGERACKWTAMPARRGTGNTPQHGGGRHRPDTSRRSGVTHLPGCQSPETQTQTKTLKTIFYFSLSHPVFSSICLPASQSGREALSMSKYRLHMDTHTLIHCLTRRQACALSVTLLFLVTCQSFSTSSRVICH